MITEISSSTVSVISEHSMRTQFLYTTLWVTFILGIDIEYMTKKSFCGGNRIYRQTNKSFPLQIYRGF